MSKKWGWWLGLTVIAIILSLVEWRAPLPTGTIDVQVAGVIVMVIALGLEVPLSYGTLILTGGAMLIENFHSWWTILPILLCLIIISIILHWRTPLDVHMSHSQAINFGLIVGLCQLVGMMVVVAIQTILMTAKWDEFTAVLGIALPVALLNGLLDCLLVPPLTLFVRRYTELKSNKE